FASSPAVPYLYSAALLILVAWTLGHRRALPGLELVALGMAMNLLVVLANGGHMPVAPALATGGPPQLHELGTWGQYALAGPGTRLNWLADTIQLPGPLGAIFPGAYSPGDLVAIVGIAVACFLVPKGRRQKAVAPP
ncbi:MAG TPA: DUF5317 family protein, partial [Chloroflexota bacterium]|nr:DUF5317 family protein [Chloroflexota bacterium]